MGAHLSQVVAQLVQAVAIVGQTKARHEHLMELLGAPAADRAAVCVVKAILKCRSAG
jgi:hypothetical protein